VKPVENVEGIGYMFEHDLKVGLPHIRANEADRSTPLGANHVKKGHDNISLPSHRPLIQVESCVVSSHSLALLAAVPCMNLRYLCSTGALLDLGCPTGNAEGEPSPGKYACCGHAVRPKPPVAVP